MGLMEARTSWCALTAPSLHWIVTSEVLWPVLADPLLQLLMYSNMLCLAAD